MLILNQTHQEKRKGKQFKNQYINVFLKNQNLAPKISQKTNIRYFSLKKFKTILLGVYKHKTKNQLNYQLHGENWRKRHRYQIIPCTIL